ncbi:hypothetical protein [Sulfitobacter sp.]|uniref:hypothetical protein n=1 Tax=Sulfitobacter sp. TaxID=1903071 RepID=UPI003568B40C
MTVPETPNAPRSEVGNTDIDKRADRIKRLQSRVEALGPVDPNFDMKVFTDELWDEESP